MVVLAASLAVERSARADDAVLVQVGARVGYAIGGGFFLGPTLSGSIGFAATDNGGFGIGLATSAFVMLGAGAAGGPTVGLTLGPELTYINKCPVLMLPMGGGGLLTFGSGRPPSLGAYAAFTALVSTNPNRRAYYEQNEKRSTFVGAGYLFLAPSRGVRLHEVSAALILPYIPGASSSAIGNCGGT